MITSLIERRITRLKKKITEESDCKNVQRNACGHFFLEQKFTVAQLIVEIWAL